MFASCDVAIDVGHVEGSITFDSAIMPVLGLGPANICVRVSHKLFPPVTLPKKLDHDL